MEDIDLSHIGGIKKGSTSKAVADGHRATKDVIFILFFFLSLFCLSFIRAERLSIKL